MLNFTRKRVKIEGSIRDSGFGLFVHKIANSLGISGFVKDDKDGLVIEAEGKNVNKFFNRILDAPMPAVVIDRINEELIPALGETIFRITGSDILLGVHNPVYLPDRAVCHKCRKELTDKDSRRYQYIFTDCPDCGLQFTLNTLSPEERAINAFELKNVCKKCRVEFNDPLDRRFHHHSISCPECGPRIKLFAHKDLADRDKIPWLHGNDENISKQIGKLLRDGNIISMKHRTSYSLICDAANNDITVKIQKWRFHPVEEFYLLYTDIASCAEDFAIDQEERMILQESGRPAVLLKCSAAGSFNSLILRHGLLAAALCTTALEHLIIRNSQPLAVFSGCIFGEAGISSAEEAFARYDQIADYFLVSDRDYETASKISIKRRYAGKNYCQRLSAGFTPAAFEIPFNTANRILALGGDVNNSFCLFRGNEAIVSAYNGNLLNLSSHLSFETLLNKYFTVYGFKPEWIVTDLQPDYMVKSWADKQRKPIKKVQHHMAHAAAVAVENEVKERVLSVVLDGGGLGDDEAVWGCEFFIGSYIAGYERAGHLNYFSIPLNMFKPVNSEAMNITMMKNFLGEHWKEQISPCLGERLSDEDNFIEALIDRKVNCRKTSSAAKFLAGAEALLQIHSDNVDFIHKGSVFSSFFQSEIIDIKTVPSHDLYHYVINDSKPVTLDPGGLYTGLLKDLESGVEVEAAYQKLIASFAAAMVDMAVKIAKRERISRICLSGGLFNNLNLLHLIETGLTDAGFTVFSNRQLPLGDANLSLGQAVLAGSISS